MKLQNSNFTRNRNYLENKIKNGSEFAAGSCETGWLAFFY